MLFAARSDDQAQIKSEEIVELGWYAIDELPDWLPADQLRIAQAVLRGEV
jgi:hypothetical protein